MDQDYASAIPTQPREIVGDAEKLNQMFAKVEGGWIGYKVFNSMYKAPKEWNIEAGSTITEKPDDVDTDLRDTCSYGINVAGSVSWVTSYVKEVLCDEFGETVTDIWKVFIPDTALIVVPTFSDGKIRVDEIRLLEVVGQAYYEDYYDDEDEDDDED